LREEKSEPRSARTRVWIRKGDRGVAAADCPEKRQRAKRHPRKKWCVVP
jgi:hypothetical protein